MGDLLNQQKETKTTMEEIATKKNKKHNLTKPKNNFSKLLAKGLKMSPNSSSQKSMSPLSNLLKQKKQEKIKKELGKFLGLGKIEPDLNVEGKGSERRLVSLKRSDFTNPDEFEESFDLDNDSIFAQGESQKFFEGTNNGNHEAPRLNSLQMFKRGRNRSQSFKEQYSRPSLFKMENDKEKLKEKNIGMKFNKGSFPSFKNKDKEVDIDAGSYNEESCELDDDCEDPTPYDLHSKSKNLAISNSGNSFQRASDKKRLSRIKKKNILKGKRRREENRVLKIANPRMKEPNSTGGGHLKINEDVQNRRNSSPAHVIAKTLKKSAFKLKLQEIEKSSKNKGKKKKSRKKKLKKKNRSLSSEKEASRNSDNSFFNFITSVKNEISKGIGKFIKTKDKESPQMIAEQREKAKQRKFIAEIKRKNKEMYKNSEKLNFSLQLKDYLSFLLPFYKPKASRIGLYRYVSKKFLFKFFP
jgi:hypothetical protein